MLPSQRLLQGAGARPGLILVATILLLALFGCSTATVRKAQSHFSTAASAENRQTLEALQRYELGVTELAGEQALIEYRLACEAADREIRGKAGELRANRLLGTAEMLRIYSMWRIIALDGEPAGAIDDATCGCNCSLAGLSKSSQRVHQAFVQGQIGLGERDRVMALAMPGFVDLIRADQTTTWADADERYCSAITLLADAAADAKPDHNVRAFLNLAQLQGFASWFGAVDDSPPANDWEARYNRVNPFAGPAVCDLSRIARTSEPGGEGPLTDVMRLQFTRYDVSPDQFDNCSPMPLLPECN